MRYQIDHDLHIHSQLSSCSRDPGQTTGYILEYAVRNNLKYICLTDHFWDSDVEGMSDWYKKQNYEHISAALPLPQSGGVAFKFGCETDMRKDMTVGLDRKNFDLFDFVIIPTTHMHMYGFTIDDADNSPERRAQLYVERLDSLLEQDYPFHKIGIAHLTSMLVSPRENRNPLCVLELISDATFAGLFRKAALKGAGIELNLLLRNRTDYEIERLMRLYRIAKREGCRFYFGSDAHHPSDFEGIIDNFERIIDLLELTDDDKFNPFE